MNRFQTRQKIYRKLIGLVLLVVAGFLVRSLVGIYGKYREAVTARNEAREDLAALALRQEKLNREVTGFEDDGGQGIERALREKFNVVRSGEYVITITEETNSTSSGSGSRRQGLWPAIRLWLGLSAD